MHRNRLFLLLALLSAALLAPLTAVAVAGRDDRGVPPADPGLDLKPATPVTTPTPGGPEAPADPATPADPAERPEDPGQSGEATPQRQPEPKAGETVVTEPTEGEVRIRLPESDQFEPLPEGAPIPVGTIVDARHGAVSLTSAAGENGDAQTAEFWGGVFRVRQRRGSPVTTLRLRGPRLRCGGGPAEASAAGRRRRGDGRRRKVRRLWGRGKGRFRTRGRHGAATVRGTWWLVRDRCDGTLVRVRRGVVAARDFDRGRTVKVRAGERYLARAGSRR